MARRSRTFPAAGIAVAAVVTGVAAGCGGADGGGDGGTGAGEVRIGVLVPLTGDLTAFGGPGARTRRA